ncbi:hypothetical protein [Kitasatospora phosalacinea]|nr:hypothetical protein [Kitasatospora phosalacinea]
MRQTAQTAHTAPAADRPRPTGGSTTSAAPPTGTGPSHPPHH